MFVCLDIIEKELIFH